MFRFKQFEVAQDKCAMKVNTDGVLLGAWADVSGAKKILDIGTGTGVIALMMAQKNSEATIEGLDIDEGAYQQTEQNFERSKWRQRLIALHADVQHFFVVTRYDIIISNPPYFVDDYKTDNHQKNIAKHSTALTYKQLIPHLSQHLLSPTGKVFLVVPHFNLPLVVSLAAVEGLFLTRLLEVTAVTGKNPYLALVQLESEQKAHAIESITIQDEAGNFTEQYKELTKEFYLKF